MMGDSKDFSDMLRSQYSSSLILERFSDYLEVGYEKSYWGTLPSRTITPDEIYNGKAICYLNKTRDRVNDECMNYFQKETSGMFIPYERKSEEKPKDIWIYEGLPVMAYNTCKDLEIVNSEEFIVICYDDNKIITASQDKTIKIYVTFMVLSI